MREWRQRDPQNIEPKEGINKDKDQEQNKDQDKHGDEERRSQATSEDLLRRNKE